MRSALVAAVSALFVASYATEARAQLASGAYVSLDGEVIHRLQASGDYLGETAGLSGTGVYAQGPGICWTTLADGSRQPGNLLLYVGEVQCCLSVVPISDKFAFSEVWVKGTGFGYRVCTNQVFRRAGD